MGGLSARERETGSPLGIGSRGGLTEVERLEAEGRIQGQWVLSWGQGCGEVGGNEAETIKK